jgi:hypothetical protein
VDGLGLQRGVRDAVQPHRGGLRGGSEIARRSGTGRRATGTERAGPIRSRCPLPPVRPSSLRTCGGERLRGRRVHEPRRRDQDAGRGVGTAPPGRPRRCRWLARRAGVGGLHEGRRCIAVGSSAGGVSLRGGGRLPLDGCAAASGRGDRGLLLGVVRLGLDCAWPWAGTPTRHRTPSWPEVHVQPLTRTSTRL